MYRNPPGGSVEAPLKKVFNRVSRDPCISLNAWGILEGMIVLKGDCRGVQHVHKDKAVGNGLEQDTPAQVNLRVAVFVANRVTCQR